jgi:hypothetical protein
MLEARSASLSSTPASGGGNTGQTLLLACVWPCATISIILFCLRIYTRLGRWRSGPLWEDVALSLALV